MSVVVRQPVGAVGSPDDRWLLLIIVRLRGSTSPQSPHRPHCDAPVIHSVPSSSLARNLRRFLVNGARHRYFLHGVVVFRSARWKDEENVSLACL